MKENFKTCLDKKLVVINQAVKIYEGIFTFGY